MKNRRVRSLALAASIFAASLATPAFAHPGHSLTDAGASHLLTSPFHLATLTVMGVAAYAGARFIQRPVPRQVLRQVLRVAGVAFLFCAAVLWGLRA